MPDEWTDHGRCRHASQAEAVSSTLCLLCCSFLCARRACQGLAACACARARSACTSRTWVCDTCWSSTPCSAYRRSLPPAGRTNFANWALLATCTVLHLSIRMRLSRVSAALPAASDVAAWTAGHSGVVSHAVQPTCTHSARRHAPRHQTRAVSCRHLRQLRYHQNTARLPVSTSGVLPSQASARIGRVAHARTRSAGTNAPNSTPAVNAPAATAVQRTHRVIHMRSHSRMVAWMPVILPPLSPQAEWQYRRHFRRCVEASPCPAATACLLRGLTRRLCSGRHRHHRHHGRVKPCFRPAPRHLRHRTLNQEIGPTRRKRALAGAKAHLLLQRASVQRLLLPS